MNLVTYRNVYSPPLPREGLNTDRDSLGSLNFKIKSTNLLFTSGFLHWASTQPPDSWGESGQLYGSATVSPVAAPHPPADYSSVRTQRPPVASCLACQAHSCVWLRPSSFMPLVGQAVRALQRGFLRSSLPPLSLGMHYLL